MASQSQTTCAATNTPASIRATRKAQRMNLKWLAAIASIGTAACTGADGQRGLNGAEGPRGPQGLPGAAADEYRPSVWIACTAAIDLLGGDGVGETHLTYQATAFSNDDLDVDCSASIGEAQSASGGGYFPAPVQGAQDGFCLAAADYPPSSAEAGFWSFTVAPTPRATYVDAGHPLDGTGHVFLSAECVAWKLNDSDVWESADISRLF
jgi:hypothetical protein